MPVASAILAMADRLHPFSRPSRWIRRDLRGHEPADLHRGEHMTHARQRLVELIEDLLTEAVAAGQVRDEVPPAELATYCLHGPAAAGSLPPKAAVRRLIAVTTTGLQPEVT